MKFRLIAPAVAFLALLLSSNVDAGLFSRGCSSCCEPSCGAPIVVQGSCCAPTCCDTSCGLGLLSRLGSLCKLGRLNRGGCCEPACGCEPTCGAPAECCEPACGAVH